MVRVGVLDSSDLWLGEMRPVRLQGSSIVLMRLDMGVVAYEDRCAHLGVPISRGSLEGDVLRCTAHNFVYDARTGCGLNPCGARLKPIAVTEEHGRIFVDVENRCEPE